MFTSGDALYHYSSVAQVLFVCSWEYLDPLRTTQAPSVTASSSSWRPIFIGVSGFVVVVGWTWLLARWINKSRGDNDDDRETSCSSVCNEEGESYRVISICTENKQETLPDS
ncbi:hypothetical protein AC1031_011277 [Aphanomyces cochlioides]|nr:hypothetical protein AC1031_011277 [Aphanomyces cochlioides]